MVRVMGTAKLSRDEMLQRLRDIQKLKPGDPHPIWMPLESWGEVVSDLCGQAADEIERLDELVSEWSLRHMSRE